MDHTAPLGDEVPASNRELSKKGGLLKRLSRSINGDGGEQVPEYLQLYGTVRGLAAVEVSAAPPLPWLYAMFGAECIAVAGGNVAGAYASVALGSRTGRQRWMYPPVPAMFTMVHLAVHGIDPAWHFTLGRHEVTRQHGVLSVASGTVRHEVDPWVDLIVRQGGGDPSAYQSIVTPLVPWLRTLQGTSVHVCNGQVWALGNGHRTRRELLDMLWAAAFHTHTALCGGVVPAPTGEPGPGIDGKYGMWGAVHQDLASWAQARGLDLFASGDGGWSAGDGPNTSRHLEGAAFGFVNGRPTMLGHERVSWPDPTSPGTSHRSKATVVVVSAPELAEWPVFALNPRQFGGATQIIQGSFGGMHRIELMSTSLGEQFDVYAESPAFEASVRAVLDGTLGDWIYTHAPRARLQLRHGALLGSMPFHIDDHTTLDALWTGTAATATAIAAG